ncbi:MAG TPA: leucine--tRNA ligase [Nitrososphaerales archaeon]|nr:leucine--tRNA ligase [Nitrososphaerales archaeon]
MEHEIEKKWRERWQAERIFEADPDPDRQKKLVTFPFPYMNGPLHIGHGFTSVRVDAYARFKRMQGYNVLFPWAWHWTGQPIVAAAERLANGDQAMVHEFVDIDKVPPSELSKFYDPKYMAEYYTHSGKIALEQLGLSLDWRREFHTTDLEPTFNKFVLWQMSKLREKGFISQGTHPVIWCPRDQSPTGDHDRVAGEGVTWEEFTLVLFKGVGEGKLSESLLPAATFRPETIFGVTNLWVNPDASYVEAFVNEKSRWVVSSPTVAKLRDQLRSVQVIREIKGRDLVGSFVEHPLDPKRKLPILPARFVDPENGTGIVYSVPAHAPMDYVALRDLQGDRPQQEEFSLSKQFLDAIVPIALVTLPGMGKYPAVEIVEKMGIKDQNDPAVEEATNEIYKKEFHLGILNEVTGEFRGKRVSEAKQLIVAQLKSRGLADSLYDLPEKVICRCLTPCVVRVLEDQWFLKYSDPEWKREAHICIDAAGIFPESARQWFHDVVDWMKDWPCARRVGLGTPLPWAPGWIVETLTDSTIYMCFYTIKPWITKLGLSPDDLIESLFDYVFLGKGDPTSVARNSKITSEHLTAMRDEFLYWYPVNLRNSAKELIPNHLTFFIFNHTALFPRELWPTGISVNGMVMIEGTKMSKSKGNVITLSSALKEFGADALRAALLGGAEGMDDLDWREKNSRDIQTKVNSLRAFVSSLESSANANETSKEMPELWLENQVQNHISKVISELDVMKTKSAFQEAFYSYWNDIRHYLSMTERRPAWLIEYVVDIFVRLLAPFIPYTSEQINADRGHTDLVSTSRFPSVERERLHPEAEIAETIIENLLTDSQKIAKLLPTRPTKLHVYSAPEWHYELFRLAAEARIRKEKISEILQKFFTQRPDLPRKEVANALSKLTPVINELGEKFVRLYVENYSKVDEKSIYADSLKYLGSALELRVFVHPWDEKADEKYDPKGKSKSALAFKPALYLE